MDAPPLRWGVLGTGWIAERFTAALHRHTRQRVVSVGSRSADSARRFADRTGIPRAHPTYADLVNDPAIDIVYVASPHNHHRAHALLGLDAGKHVLVQKPLALNAVEAEEIADRAAARGVVCAEALWTFFLPRYDVIRQLLDDGVLGDVHTVLADNANGCPPHTASTATTSQAARCSTSAPTPWPWRTGSSVHPSTSSPSVKRCRAARSTGRYQPFSDTAAPPSRRSTPPSWPTPPPKACSPEPEPCW